jgi:hypothetical protein
VKPAPAKPTVEATAMEAATMEATAMEAATAVETATPAMGCFGRYRLGQCEDPCHRGRRDAQARCGADALHLDLLLLTAPPKRRSSEMIAAAWKARGPNMKSNLIFSRGDVRERAAHHAWQRCRRPATTRRDDF